MVNEKFKKIFSSISGFIAGLTPTLIILFFRRNDINITIYRTVLMIGILSIVLGLTIIIAYFTNRNKNNQKPIF